MGTATRRRRAIRAAIVSGVLLMLSGGAGSAWLAVAGWEFVHVFAPEVASVLAPLVLVAVLIATLGGLSVLAGAWMLHRHRRIAGKLFIALGAGTGLFGLLLNFGVFVFAGGNPLDFLLSLALTVYGAGILLAVYAQARA